MYHINTACVQEHRNENVNKKFKKTRMYCQPELPRGAATNTRMHVLRRTRFNGPVRAAWVFGGATAVPGGPHTPGVPRSPPWPVEPCPARSWWPPCRVSPRSLLTGMTPAIWSARAAATGSRTTRHWSPYDRGARCHSTRRPDSATRHATVARPAASSGWRSCPSPDVASCANHPPCMSYIHTRGHVHIVIRYWHLEKAAYTIGHRPRVHLIQIQYTL